MDNGQEHFSEAAEKRTQKSARGAIEEARMVLPGIQALFGFQLIAVFNNRFTEIPPYEQKLHLCAALLVAIAIALIMTPAAYHRQAEPHGASEFFVRLTSLLITAAMAPLMIGLCLEIYILSDLILDDGGTSAAIAGLLLLLFAGLWFALPNILRRGESERWLQEESGRQSGVR